MCGIVMSSNLIKMVRGSKQARENFFRILDVEGAPSDEDSHLLGLSITKCVVLHFVGDRAVIYPIFGYDDGLELKQKLHNLWSHEFVNNVFLGSEIINRSS